MKKYDMEKVKRTLRLRRKNKQLAEDYIMIPADFWEHLFSYSKEDQDRIIKNRRFARANINSERYNDYVDELDRSLTIFINTIEFNHMKFPKYYVYGLDDYDKTTLYIENHRIWESNKKHSIRIKPVIKGDKHEEI